MARKARLALADMRAVEEEAERLNPINPKKELGARRGYVGILRDPAVVVKGAGATPSMGLSTVRGGGLLGEDGHGQRVVGAGLLGEDGHGQRVVGAGTKKGQTRKTARRAYEDIGRRSVALHRAEHHALGDEEESESDEELSGGAAGKMMATRMLELHGRGFFDDFAKGFMSVIKPVAGVAKAVLPFTGPQGAMASTVLGALGAGKKKGASKKGCGDVSGPGYEALGSGVMSGGLRTGAYQGKGFLSDLGIPVISDIAGAIGLGKKKRAPAGASDKRKARGALVSKLMREEGMSLAEASRHIKEHKLL